MSFNSFNSSSNSNRPIMEFNLKPLSNNKIKNKPKASHKDIMITSHAMLRAEERLNLSNKKDLKKLAYFARYKGINISLIRRETYNEFGLNFEEYKFIKGRFSNMNHSTNIYLYQGSLFIFCGKGNKTLKTVINLTKLV